MFTLTMLRRLAVVLAVSLMALVLPASMPAAEAAAPYCGITWGSLRKATGTLQDQQLTNVRTGRHTCYDRLVVDLKGRTPAGYSVRYVDNVYQEGSGDVIPLRGGAKLELVVLAPAYDGSGNSTYRPANPKELTSVYGFSTFRQVAWAGSFEGQSTIGLGVRARLPFRVFVLDDGLTSRLVIDVAQRW